MTSLIMKVTMLLSFCMLSETFEGLQSDEGLNTTAISDVTSPGLTRENLIENTYMDNNGEFLSKFL